MSDVGSDLASESAIERWQPRTISTVPTSHKVLRKSLNRRDKKATEGLAQGQVERVNEKKPRKQPQNLPHCGSQ